MSSVDSGNLAASLATLRQGCLLLLQQPIIEQGTLEGLRDHVLRLRDEVPYDSRTFSTMKLFGSLLRQLECQPKDLFFWEAVLTESRDLMERIKRLSRRCTRGPIPPNCATGRACFPGAWTPRSSSFIGSAPWLAPALRA